MKFLPYIAAGILLIATTGCKSHYETGWYHVSNDGKSRIIGKALFTPADFTDLHIDTVPQFGIPYIQGRIIESRRNDWADTTEKLIGRRFGFVYNDSIITEPTINTRIESGTFQIISTDKHLLRTLYTTLTTLPD